MEKDAFGGGEAGKDDGEIMKALDMLLEGHYWPTTLDTGQIYARRHDDTDGKDDPTQYLSLEIDQWGDVHMQIPPGKFRALRFRMPGGGGQSERVRKALIILAEAIRRDNDENPQS